MSASAAAVAVADLLDLDPNALPGPVAAIVAVVEARGFTDGDALTGHEQRRAHVALAAADVQERHRRAFVADAPARPGSVQALTGH